MQTARAQSSSVGVLLLTAVVVIAVGAGSVLYLGSSGISQTASPLVDADVELTPSDLVVTHAGGDAVAMGDLTVVVRGGDSSGRYDVESGAVDGNGDDRFESTEVWRTGHGLAERTDVVVRLVHEGANAVLVREHATVPRAPANRAPFASISANVTAVGQGDPVEFDASGSTDDGTVVAYRWDWNGDGIVDETTNGSLGTHSYETSGIYDAAVEVVDDGGRTDRGTVTISVGAEPTASVTLSSAYAEPGEVITANASGSDPGAGAITDYEWDWTSDGTFEASGETATHSYANAGTYEITLRVTNDVRETNTTSRTVTVTEDPEPSLAYRPEAPNTGDTVTVDASDSTDPDGSIERFEWDFDGDGSVDATGERATHTFSEYGERPVTLTVTDDAGASNSTSETVSVNARPVADFTWQQTQDGELTLDGTPSRDPDGTIESYRWRIQGQWFPRYGETTTQDIEDETNSSVTLEVTDDDGATDTVTKEIPYTLQGPGFGAGVAVIVILAGAAARRRGLV